jgi:hypothetical protein
MPEYHLAYFVSDVVDHLDLSAIEKVYGPGKRGQATNDKQQLMPLIEAIEEQSGQRPAEVIADSGYRSEQNLEELDSDEAPERRMQGYVATTGPRGQGCLYSSCFCQGATRADRMKRKLKTKAIPFLDFA